MIYHESVKIDQFLEEIVEAEKNGRIVKCTRKNSNDHTCYCKVRAGYNGFGRCEIGEGDPYVQTRTQPKPPEEEPLKTQGIGYINTNVVLYTWFKLSSHYTDLL